MADPQKLVHRNYPPIDFRVGCTCPACELATLLWYTEDEHPAREAWQLFWDHLEERENPLDWGWMRERPCIWQLRQAREVEARPKPTAYKIC